MNELVSNYISEIKDKNIHIVGLASTECSNIALFLHKHGIKNVTLHQSTPFEKFEKDFITSHQGLKNQA